MIFLPLLAATVLASAVPQADVDDLHCLAYLSVAAGKVEGEKQRLVDGGAVYYFGRIEARSPQLDIAAELDTILKSPDYSRETYEADKARCHGQLDPLAGHFAAWRARYEAGK